MALMQRRILLIGIVAYVLIGIFFVAVLYRPRLAARQRSAAEVARLSRELAETRERVKGIGRLRARVAELEAAEAAFAARVVPRSDLLPVMQQLAKLAQEARVRFVEIAPPGLDTLLQQESPTAPLRAVPFVVTVQGRYLDIGKYVESLKDFSYFVRVPDFEVTARDDIRPEVEMKLLVNLYTSSLAQGGKL